MGWWPVRVNPDAGRPGVVAPPAPRFVQVSAANGAAMALTASGEVWRLLRRDAGWFPIEQQPCRFTRLGSYGFAQDEAGLWWEWMGWWSRNTRYWQRLPEHQYVRPDPA